MPGDLDKGYGKGLRTASCLPPLKRDMPSKMRRIASERESPDLRVAFNPTSFVD